MAGGGVSDLHALLLRQLGRVGLDADAIPTSAEHWRALLARVSRAYHEAEQDRYLLERSQDLVSEELVDLNRDLEIEKSSLEARVAERTRLLQQSEAHLSGIAAGPAARNLLGQRTRRF